MNIENNEIKNFLFTNKTNLKDIICRFYNENIGLYTITKNFAEILIKNKEYDISLMFYDILICINPSDINNYIRKTVVLRYKKNYKDAINLLECVMLKFSLNPLVLSVHADTCIDIKDYDYALNILQFIVSKYSDYKNSYQRISLILEKKNDLISAKKFFLKSFFDKSKNDRIKKFKEEIANKNIYFSIADIRKIKFKHDKIRVAFVFNSIAQHEHLIPVYEMMKSNSLFEPFFYVFTAHDQFKDTYQYMKEKYPQKEGHLIYGAKDKNVIDPLIKYEPDYTFLQRPYPGDYPYDMDPFILSNYSNIILILYGVNFSILPKHYINCKRMYSSIFAYVAESDEHAKFYKNYIDEKIILTFGHPKFDTIKKLLEKRKNSNKIRIFWNEHLSQIKFLEYFEVIKKILANPMIEFTIRPHPFLRRYLEKNNIMTKKKFDDYMNYIVDHGGKYQDATSGEPYLETLMNTDILISGFSSLIMEYSVLSKPTIYLSDIKHDNAWLTDFTNNYLNNCVYKAGDINGLYEVYEYLVNNKNSDKLKENREKYSEKIKFIKNYSISEKIVNFLIDKFTKN